MVLAGILVALDVPFWPGVAAPRGVAIFAPILPSAPLSFICFVPGLPFRGVTEETCLGEVAGSGHTAGLEGLIKGSELPGVGRVGLRQGLLLGVLAQEGVDVLAFFSSFPVLSLLTPATRALS